MFIMFLFWVLFFLPLESELGDHKEGGEGAIKGNLCPHVLPVTVFLPPKGWFLSQQGRKPQGWRAGPGSGRGGPEARRLGGRESQAVAGAPRAAESANGSCWRQEERRRVRCCDGGR